MKKNLFIVLGGVVILVGVFFFFNKKEVLAPVADIKPIQLCFYKENKTSNDFYDVSWLKMNLLGDKVTGEFRNLPAEKDSKVGTFEGAVGPVDKTAMARTADVWWNSMAEGMQVKEQLRIVFGEGNAEAGFGEMVDRGDGVYVYKNAEKLTYGVSMNDVACSEIDERIVVEKYVRDNVGTIVIQKPVLGGTWYVTNIHVDPKSKIGVMTYEDGHIQGHASFTYTLDGSRVLIKI